jgi:hypothetical protein
MKNRILLTMVMMLLLVTVSCTPGQGNLGTDVGNPLPDEADVLIPINTYKGFCFILELEPEMKWEEISDTEVNISDGDLVVDVSFAEAMDLYCDNVIDVPDAMAISDKKALLKYTGPGFDYDDSADLPTAFMDVGDDREIARINPDARTLVSMKGDRAFIENISVSLDTSEGRCSVHSDKDGDDGDGDGGGAIVPAFEPGDFEKPVDGFDDFHIFDNAVHMEMNDTVAIPSVKKVYPGGLLRVEDEE